MTGNKTTGDEKKVRKENRKRQVKNQYLRMF